MSRILTVRDWAKSLNPYLILTFLSALVYLPHAIRLGFYRDDWYYIADGYFGGAKIFHTMFWIDRPARGYLFELLFNLFGLKAVYYHLLMWVWRCSAGIFSFALFNSIWPSHRNRNLGIALIFTLYPGFLWWVSGVEYQPMVLSLAAHIASIWFTILLIGSTRFVERALFFFLALAGGWVSLWLVDYAIGMEVFRLVCIYLYYRDRAAVGGFRNLWRPVLSSSYIGILVMGGFLSWRLLFFSGARLDTDIGFQLGKLLQNPVAVTLAWVINLGRSFYSVLVESWYTSLRNSLPILGAPEKISVLVLSLIFLLGLLFAARRGRQKNDQSNVADDSAQWAKMAIAGGVVGVFGCLVPIIIMNRVVTIEAFSHYALPASLPAALIIVGCLSLIALRSVRVIAAFCLLVVSVISVHSHALAVLREEQTISEFWRQFSLRAPGLTRGTTLLVGYPGIAYGEENDIVWGPANFVYLSPQEVITTEGQIVYPVTAAKMQMDVLQHIQLGAQTDDSYRSHVLMLNFENLLVASQPTPASCVHVMDARWPRMNEQDGELILLAAEFSKVERISLDSTPLPLNPQIFGDQVQGWCSYYQAAELKVQAQNWPAVLALLEEAQSNGYGPADPVEWLPFLQAAMVMGDQAVIARIASVIDEAPMLKVQVRELLSALAAAGYEIDADTRSLVEQLFEAAPSQ